MADRDANENESLNLVLDHDPQIAIAQIRANSLSTTVCVISPSPRAERRMTDDDFVHVFQCLGQILRGMTRLEIHFYASDLVWLPARAMAACLRASPKLIYLLMNGMRIKGGPEDVLDLGHAFRLHPSLNRMCVFNIQPWRPDNVPLNPMLHLIVKNPVIKDLALRYTEWSQHSLDVVCNPESQLKTIRLTGKDTLGRLMQKLPLVLNSLKTNTMLTEFRINQCPAPPGMGLLIAGMLKVNKTLKSCLVEFQSYRDAVPICKVMETENKTLTLLDMYTASQAVRRVQEERRQRAMQEMRTNRNWRDNAGAIRGIVMTEQEKEEENTDQAIMRDSCVKMLEKNTTLTTLVLGISGENLVTSTMELYLRLNRDGLRKNLLQNDALSRKEVIQFFRRFRNDTNILWFILRLKPELISIATIDNEPKKKRATPARRQPKRAAAAAATAASSSRKRKTVAIEALEASEEQQPPARKTRSGRTSRPPSRTRDDR